VFRGVVDVSVRKERVRDIISESIMMAKTRKLNSLGKCGGHNGGSLNELSTCLGLLLHKGAVLPGMTLR
jgi:hypothetical protein